MTPRIRTLAGVPVRNTFLNYEPPGAMPGQKLIIEEFAPRKATMHTEDTQVWAPRKLEIWLVPDSYEIAVQDTSRQAPIPSKVLIHYIKKGESASTKLLPPALVRPVMAPPSEGGNSLFGAELIYSLTGTRPSTTVVQVAFSSHVEVAASMQAVASNTALPNSAGEESAGVNGFFA